MIPSNPFKARSYGELQKVTDCVYIYRNITNSSFVIGQESVAVIDTQVNRPTAEQLLKQIRSVTSKPIKYVINTHYHWDHTNGNQLFADQGAEIISSKMTKEFMMTRAPRQKAFLSGRGFELGMDPLLPQQTFEGEHHLDLGDMPLKIFYAGNAESDDASAIWVENQRVLMAGDTIMTGSFPIFGQPCWDEGLQGDGQWQKTIANLISLEPEHVIPGHGPLAYQKDVEFLLKIENYFVDEIKPLVTKGMNISEVLQCLEPKLPRWITEVPVVWGTPRYAILRVYRGLTRHTDTSGEEGWQKFKPNVLNDLLNMAHEAGEGGDTVTQVSILKKACEVNPSDCNALAAYADTLIDLSRKQDSVLEKGDFFSEARIAWDKSLSTNPLHLQSLLGKGRYMTMMAFRGGDDPTEGMQLLEKAQSLYPKGRQAAEIEFFLGIGFRRLGDEIKAKKQFKKAISHDMTFMPAHIA